MQGFPHPLLFPDVVLYQWWSRIAANLAMQEVAGQTLFSLKTRRYIARSFRMNNESAQNKDILSSKLRGYVWGLLNPKDH